jgi:peroxiredoxin
MKPIISLITLLSFALALTGQGLTFHPAQPAPGEKIKIKYDPAGTALDGAEKIYAVVVLIGGDTPEVTDVEMHRKDNYYKGEFASGEKTTAVFIRLENEDIEKVDNNSDMGYWTMMYEPDRATPVAGAYAGVSHGYWSFSYQAGTKRNADKAMKYLQKEFRKNPESKSDKTLMSNYAYLAQSTKDDAAKGEVKALATSIANTKKAAEDEWMRAYNLLSAIEDEEGKVALAEKIRKKYPKGQLYKNELLKKFYDEKDLATRVNLFNEYQKLYGAEKESGQTLSNFARLLAGGYARQENWEQFDHYLAMVTDLNARAGLLNNIAWNLSGEGLDGEAGDLERAAKLSKESLKLVKDEIDNPTQKPSHLTKRAWVRNLNFSYGMYADTYALILFRNGNAEKALKYQTIACEGRQFKDGELNERYAVYHEKRKGPEATEKLLADLIREGNASSKMKEQHKRLFLGNNTIEDAYGLYVEQLEKEAKVRYREEIRKKMIDQLAPDFTLVNLNGESVSLSELRGKTVVLDFWATWCGPCIASFPGMQRAVDQYKDDDKVVFLFIDTWENAKDKQKNAADFISKNNYTFNVPMDNENEVVAKYGVDGIPTKFVVDPNGYIRFKSVGFGGNDEKLLIEMETMIEIAREAGKKALP